MKKILLSIVTIITISLSSFSQAPESFKYQAVIRDASNNILNNQAVGIRMTIQQGSIGGTTAYQETFSTTTNAYGLVNLEIGGGTVVSGDIINIDWANGPYYIETAVDVSGGTSYIVMGNSQLLSVPYALYAKTSGSSTPGPQGPAGNDGADGADGATGPMGPQGPAGNDGAVGATGPMGPQGPAGNDGAVGATGPMGPQGPAGNDGAVGATGPMGPQGPAGNDGAVGATGPAGPIAGADKQIIFNNAGVPDGSSNFTWDNTTSTQTIVGTSVTTNEIITSLGGSGTRYLTTDDSGNIGATSFPGIIGSGSSNYNLKWTGASTVGNSMIQDNGSSLSINYPIQSNAQLFVYRQQQTAAGDGQTTLMGYRDRNTQNQGTGYAQAASNTGVTGSSFWGDDYSFGVGGWNYNDFVRTGGVIGSEIYGAYFGILGYKAASTNFYGVYGSNAMGTGSGLLPTTETSGIGGGFFGSMIGTISKGEIAGQLNSGELFAAYNSGNTYTTGKNIELVNTEEITTPVYAVTSVDAKIYNSGVTQLVNGQVYIEFDSNYKALLGENPVVTVTPNGDCNGVFIASVDKNGFLVKEMNSGNSTVNISWISVGTRIDNRMEEATRIVSSPGFDRNIQQVLISDSNLDSTPDGIWWDGQTIRFGKIPPHLTTSKRPSTK